MQKKKKKKFKKPTVEEEIEIARMIEEKEKEEEDLIEIRTVECCGNCQTQSPIAIQGSKSLKMDIKQEVHKRT